MILFLFYSHISLELIISRTKMRSLLDRNRHRAKKKPINSNRTSIWSHQVLYNYFFSVSFRLEVRPKSTLFSRNDWKWNNNFFVSNKMSIFLTCSRFYHWRQCQKKIFHYFLLSHCCLALFDIISEIHLHTRRLFRFLESFINTRLTHTHTHNTNRTNTLMAAYGCHRHTIRFGFGCMCVSNCMKFSNENFCWCNKTEWNDILGAFTHCACSIKVN